MSRSSVLLSSSESTQAEENTQLNHGLLSRGSLVRVQARLPQKPSKPLILGSADQSEEPLTEAGSVAEPLLSYDSVLVLSTSYSRHSCHGYTRAWARPEVRS